MTVCPDELLGTNGFFGVVDAKKTHVFTKTQMGYKTGLSLAWKATSRVEKARFARSLTYAWCGAVYVSGAMDALYQQYHNDIHIGMALGDWFIDTTDSIYSWYNNTRGSIHDWWENEDHWWK